MTPLGRGHSPGATVRAAREAYFARNGFGDGGYEDRWVVLRAGPLTIRFPNTKARVAAVRLHDLHHVATGYDTSWVGEGELGAWEIAGGCGRHLAAWMLNLNALGIGVLLAPSRMWLAFRRGSAGRTLYHGDRVEDWLDRPLGDLQADLGCTTSAVPPRSGGMLRFLPWTALGLGSLAVSVATLFLPIAVIGWLATP